MNEQDVHFRPVQPEMEDLQLAELRRTFQYLNRKSPFYQKHFAENGITLQDISAMDDLSQIPTVSKADLQHQTQNFWCVPLDAIRDYCSTSGTEGKPVTVPLTESDLCRLARNEKQALQIANVTASDIVQLTTTADRQFMAGRAYMEGVRQLGAAVVRSGSGLPEMQWQHALRFNSSVLIAVPSFINRMLDYADEHAIDVRKTSICKAICIGESIRNPDFSLNALGQRIAHRWPIHLHATYASTEMATAFTECEAGLGGHLQPDLLHAQALDENGRELPDGQVGELTITTFGIEGMPLLRFRTGDICALHSQPCLCGRTSPRVGPVVGRKNQMIKCKGTTCYPPAIFAVLDSFLQIKYYQVELEKNAQRGDQLTVRYFVNGKLSAPTLAERFRSVLRFSPHLIECSQEEIKQRIYPKNNRKAFRFVTLRM